MLLAYDFPLLSLLLAFLEVALLIVWVFAIIWAFVDNFRRTDHSGWAKAGWTILILLLPVLGVIIYLVARPPTASLSE
jgi:hypothetical protein